MSAGLDITKIATADSRNYANIEMSDLKLDQNALLGEQDLAGETLEKILDLGRIAISAEMLGNTEEAFEVTVNYLKERKQFGVQIGSFKHFSTEQQKCFAKLN